MRKITLALVALATAAAIAPNAVAGTISFTTTVPSTLTDFTANPAVSQFNTALGTLEDVIITFSGSGGTVVTATNNSSSSTSKLTQVSTDLFYTLADGVGGYIRQREPQQSDRDSQQVPPTR